MIWETMCCINDCMVISDLVISLVRSALAVNYYTTKYVILPCTWPLSLALESKRNEQILHSKMQRFIQCDGSRENMVGGAEGMTTLDVEGWWIPEKMFIECS